MAKEYYRPKPLLPYCSYVDDLINLACDQIEIEHLDPEVPKNFIPKVLIREGKIGFLKRDDPSRGFYRANETGEPGRYDVYRNFFFYTRYGGFYASYDEGARLIPANATKIPPVFAFERAGVMLDMADRSIAANIRAQIYGRVLQAGTDKQRETLLALLDSVESGKPIVVTPEAGEILGSSLDLTVPVTFDKVLLARSAIWSGIVKRVGSVAADQYKKERVQSMEVDAAIGETIDSVYIMINSFNEAAKREDIRGLDGGLIQMKYTGYAARFDEDGEDDPAEPQNDPNAAAGEEDEE